MNLYSLLNRTSIPFLFGCLTALILALLFSRADLNKIWLFQPKKNHQSLTSGTSSLAEIARLPEGGKISLPHGLPPQGIAGDDQQIKIPDMEMPNLEGREASSEESLILPKVNASDHSSEKLVDEINSAQLEKPSDLSPQQKTTNKLARQFNSANQNINDFYFFDQQFSAKKFTAKEKLALAQAITTSTSKLNNDYQDYLKGITGREKSNFQTDQKNWEEKLSLDAKFLKENYSEDLVLKNAFDKLNERNILLDNLKDNSSLTNELTGVYSDGAGGTLLVEASKPQSFKFNLKVLRNARYANASEISGEAKIEDGLGLYIKNHAKADAASRAEVVKIFFKIEPRLIKISNSNTDYLFPLGVSLDGNYRKIFESTKDYYLTGIKADSSETGSSFMKTISPEQLVSDYKTQYVVGHKYLEGTDLIRDYQKANFWLRKSALAKYPPANFDLYKIYAYGLGQTKNEETAALYLNQARAGKLPEAFLHSGVARLKGEIYPQNYQLALADLNQAKALGNPEANLILGLVYLHGFGVPQDTEQALQLLHLATEQKVSEAYTILGDIYQDSTYQLQDLMKSTAYYEQGHIAGNQNSSLNFALQLMKSKQAKTQQEGLRILKYLADSEHPGAEFQYANYLISKLGEDDSLAIPLTYLRNAAEQGHINSYYLLGVFYESPRLKNNYPKAIMYYNKAILGNHPGAYKRLAELYRTGKGVPLDRQRADWLLQKSIDLES